MNYFREKQIEIDLLATLDSVLESKIKDEKQEYKQIGMKQRETWNSETHKYELVWEDDNETVPALVPDYQYVDKDLETLSDEEIYTIKACEKLREALKKLI